MKMRLNSAMSVSVVRTRSTVISPAISNDVLQVLGRSSLRAISRMLDLIGSTSVGEDSVRPCALPRLSRVNASRYDTTLEETAFVAALGSVQRGRAQGPPLQTPLGWLSALVGA